jgi:carbamoyl-phosphate synthase large subunit
VSEVNVLFTSVGRRVELLRAFRRAYATLGLDGRIVGVDIDPLAPALRECDSFFMVPRFDDPSFVPALVEVCKRERIGLLFPLIDPEIPVLARARHELDATGARAMVLPAEAAETTADKQATAELFERIGVPVPRRSPDEFPVFVKPRSGSAGVHTHKAVDDDELRFWLERVPDAVVEEHLPGPEITTDVLCLEDGHVAGICSRRRIEVRSGEVSKGVTLYDETIADHCVTIAEALDARGPITVQCLLKDGEPRFTEVNARFGGGAPLGFAAGVESPRWLLAHAAGLPLELPPLGSYERGLHMTRYDESLFIREEDRAADARRRL